MRPQWHCLAACFALLLAGCYVSKAPFITPATADYPIASGTRFDTARPSGKEWRRQPGRTVHRAGAHYVYVEDGSPKRSVPFLLKEIAPKRYILQLSDSSDPGKVSEYYYALLDYDGATAIQFQAGCMPRDGWIGKKWIDKVEPLSMGDRCLFSSLGNLTSVLQDASIKAAPELRFTRARTAPAPKP